MADAKQRYRIIGDHPHKGDVVTVAVDDKGRFKGQSFAGGPFMHLCFAEACSHGNTEGFYAQRDFLRKIGDDE